MQITWWGIYRTENNSWAAKVCCGQNSAWARDQSDTRSEGCQTSWAPWDGTDPQECRFDLIPAFWSMGLNISFIFTKFKISAHTRIMYDRDILLILGGCPRVGCYMCKYFYGRGQAPTLLGNHYGNSRVWCKKTIINQYKVAERQGLSVNRPHIPYPYIILIIMIYFGSKFGSKYGCNFY